MSSAVNDFVKAFLDTLKCRPSMNLNGVGRVCPSAPTKRRSEPPPPKVRPRLVAQFRGSPGTARPTFNFNSVYANT